MELKKRLINFMGNKKVDREYLTIRGWISRALTEKWHTSSNITNSNLFSGCEQV